MLVPTSMMRRRLRARRDSRGSERRPRARAARPRRRQRSSRATAATKPSSASDLGAERPRPASCATVAPDHAEHARAASRARSDSAALTDAARRAVDEQRLARDQVRPGFGSHRAPSRTPRRWMPIAARRAMSGAGRELALVREHVARETAAPDETEDAVAHAQTGRLPGRRRLTVPADLEARERPAASPEARDSGPLRCCHIGRDSAPHSARCDRAPRPCPVRDRDDPRCG